MANGIILNSLKIPNNDIDDIINSNSDTTLCIESNKPGLYEKVSSLWICPVYQKKWIKIS